MNLVAGAPTWLLALLVLLLCLAAAEDARRLRISNITCIGVLAGAVAAAMLNGIELGVWQNLVVFASILVLGTLAFRSGLLGGGDVKLFAAAGLWFDLHSAIWFVACVFLAGGLLGLLYLTVRAARGGGIGKRVKRVPYGIAIAAGALLLIAIEAGWIGSPPFGQRIGKPAAAGEL